MSPQETSTVHRRYTLAQLCQLLAVPRGRVRSWIKAGLVQPASLEDGGMHFDFRHINAVKTLWKLTQAGVKIGRLRRCLEQLRAWFPDVQDPLAQLGLLEEHGQVVIRLEEGQLAEPSGQQHFDFETQAEKTKTAVPCSSAEPWRQRGHYLEGAGDLESAALAYRQALLEDGPDAGVCFNLGNVLYRLGRKEQALERLRQAVELDNRFAEAWNNLGNVLADLGQAEEAADAYHQALLSHPDYADVHYNLADTLDQMDRVLDALQFFRSYLRLEPQGAWAEYARQRIRTLSSRSG